MENVVLEILEWLGSLAIFLYGMKMMSEALLKIAGSRMKSILAVIRSNRIVGMLMGVVVTMIVQSSSATIVMLVSAVNAGIITLGESIGMIMGANIGTTITGWIIAFFGFNVDVWFLVLPMIGVAMPFVFSKVNKRHSWGEAILGFSLIFMGIHFLRITMPYATSLPSLAEFVNDYCQLGTLSIIIFLAIGTAITILVQSSSATMAFTIVLCMHKWIPFEIGAAMILGENIGTTVTANIAAQVGNISAKRAAFVHFLFNATGAVIAVILFKPFLHLVDTLTVAMLDTSPYDDGYAVPIALATLHTSFNLINTVIFISFTSMIERIVMHFKRGKKNEEEEFHLKYISTGLMSTSELSLIQAKKEISFFAKHTQKMFSFVRELEFDSDMSESKFGKLYSKIESYEKISDDVEYEIANYLTKVNQARMSDSGRRRSKSMIKIVGELESIGDCNFTMARLINKMHEQKIRVTKKMSDKIAFMFNMVDEALNTMLENLDKLDFSADVVKAQEIETQINRYRDQVKAENFDNIKLEQYSYEQSVFFMDLIQECENLGNRIVNVSEILDEAVD
ncbi:MAG: Na/Pi cotransporter family protein [Bacteroidales bacterium]|nr:Na/Pi cotransporter family protein [Bacteroidales bacterium]